MYLSRFVRPRCPAPLICAVVHSEFYFLFFSICSSLSHLAGGSGFIAMPSSIETDSEPTARCEECGSEIVAVELVLAAG